MAELPTHLSTQITSQTYKRILISTSMPHHSLFWLNVIVIWCYLVVVAPVISYDDALKDGISQKAGSTLTIYVDIKGFPAPKVSWSCNEDVLFEAKNVSIETSNTGSTITIKGLTNQNTGLYKIKATNKVGEAEAQFQVNVKGQFSNVALLFFLYLPFP